VANGVVYVGSRDNYLYAISASTGRAAWKSQVGWVPTAPQVVGQMVCVATNSGEFSAIHTSSGGVVWQARTTPAAFAQPWAVNGGTMILCLDTGVLQAYDVATGKQGATYGSQNQDYQAIGAAGGNLYAMDDTGTLHAFSAGTGTTLWNTGVVTDGGVPSTGLVVGGGDIYTGTTSGTLYSIHAATGQVNWSYPAGNDLTSDPVAADGMVYITDTSGTLHAITATGGKRAWQHASAPGLAGPAAAGGKVYVSTGSALQELDAKSGDAGWSYSPPDIGSFISTPAVAGGLVFIGCTDDSLYALHV
jgi:outer membrane protein assembly factor BamB